jgi:hypothetical protein
MGAYARLFSVVVEHAYFTAPGQCRLRFQPDADTAVWLARAGCVTRPSANAFDVWYESADDPAAGRSPPARTGAPALLRFDVSPNDPLFTHYTDFLAPTAAGARAPRPVLLFDATSADRDPEAGVWDVWPQQRESDGGVASDVLSVRPDFSVLIPLAGDLQEAGRVYRISFMSRATVWKYLLMGDWNDDRPCVVGAVQAAAMPSWSAYPVDEPTPIEVLADGRPAIALRSPAAIAMAERPDEQFQLWSRSADGARDRLLVRRLPAANAGSLALETPGNPQTLVSEIYVTR